MKFRVLPLAFCAALAGCAMYPSYPYVDPNVVVPAAPAVPYPPVYAYPYAYAYPPVYAYPYDAGAYWYPSVWIGGSAWCCSGGHWHHRHHEARPPQGDTPSQGGGLRPGVLGRPGR